MRIFCSEEMSFICKVQFVPKSKLRALSCQRLPELLCPVGVNSNGVYSTVPHCHSCTHSALSTLQLPYRRPTLCTPPPAGYLLYLLLFYLFC